MCARSPSVKSASRVHKAPPCGTSSAGTNSSSALVSIARRPHVIHGADRRVAHWRLAVRQGTLAQVCGLGSAGLGAVGNCAVNSRKLAISSLPCMKHGQMPVELDDLPVLCAAGQVTVDLDAAVGKDGKFCGMGPFRSLSRQCASAKNVPVHLNFLPTIHLRKSEDHDG